MRRDQKTPSFYELSVRAAPPEGFYESLISNLPIITYRFFRETDGKLHFLYLSDRIDRKFFDAGTGEVGFDSIHRDDLQSLTDALDASDRDLSHLVWSGRFIAENGQTRWLRTTSMPTRQKDGRVVWDGVLTDVGDQVRKDQETEAARFNTLERSRLDSIAQISGNVAHELNTPLCTMQLLLEQLLSPRPGSKLSAERTEEKLNQLQITTRKLIRIVRAFRTVIKGSSEISQPAASVNIVEAIESTLLISSERLTRTGIQLVREYSLESELAYIGHPSKLMQILLDLLKNSQEALGESERKEISIGLTREEDQAVIRVKDNGSGILAGDRPHLFEPYFSTKGADGQGISLALARRSANLDGWNLGIESYGNPTIFRLEIPLSDECLILNSKA